MSTLKNNNLPSSSLVDFPRPTAFILHDIVRIERIRLKRNRGYL